MDVAHVQEVRGDLLTKEQGVAVVELDAILEGLEGAHGHHGVFRGDAAAHLPCVVELESQVQEGAPSAAQAAGLRPVRITAADADVEQLGRLARLPRIDGERVPVEGPNAPVDDLVTAAVAGADRLLDVFVVDRLAQALIEGLNNVIEITVTMGVQLEVELLGLMTEHVRQGTGDALGESALAHVESVGVAGTEIGPRRRILAAR